MKARSCAQTGADQRVAPGEIRDGGKRATLHAGGAQDHGEQQHAQIALSEANDRVVEVDDVFGTPVDHGVCRLDHGTCQRRIAGDRLRDVRHRTVRIVHEAHHVECRGRWKNEIQVARVGPPLRTSSRTTCRGRRVCDRSRRRAVGRATSRSRRGSNPRRPSARRSRSRHRGDELRSSSGSPLGHRRCGGGGRRALTSSRPGGRGGPCRWRRPDGTAGLTRSGARAESKIREQPLQEVHGGGSPVQ